MDENRLKEIEARWYLGGMDIDVAQLIRAVRDANISIADLEAELATSCRANAMLSETIQELRSDLALTVGQLQERAEWDEAHKRAADWEEGISA